MVSRFLKLIIICLVVAVIGLSVVSVTVFKKRPNLLITGIGAISKFFAAIADQGVKISPDLTYYYSGTIGGVDGASDIAVDSSGRIYVTCCNWGAIKIYDKNKNFIKTFDQTNPKIGEGAVAGIYTDSEGKIYVASGAGYVQIFDFEGNFLKGIGQSRTQSDLGNCPGDVAKDAAGNLYMTQRCKNRVAIFDSTEQEIAGISSETDNNYKFNYPTRIHIDKQGLIYVLDSQNNRVQIYTPDRKYLATLSGLNYAYDIATDSAGNIYVANGDHKIWIYDKNRNFLTSFGGWGSGEYEFRVPRGLAFDQNGRLYVVDGFIGLTEDRVRIYSPLISEALTNPDIAPPTLNLSAPANGSKITNSLIISGIASDDTMVSSISVWMAAAVYGGSKNCGQISITPAATVNFSQDMWDCLPIATFTEGSKITIGIKALDSSANFTEKSVEVYSGPEVADTFPPTIVLTSPQENEAVAELVLMGKISDLSGVPEYRVIINDAAENSDCNQLFGFIPQQLEIPFSHSFSQCLKDGPNKIIIKTKDIKGNSASRQINVIKKTAAVSPDENRVRGILIDSTLGGVIEYYRGHPEDSNSVEAVKRWDQGVRVTNSDQFERKIVNGQWAITYKGTNTQINALVDVKLTTDAPAADTTKEINITKKAVEVPKEEKATEEKPKEKEIIQGKLKMMNLSLSAPSAMMVGQGLVWVIAKATENSQPLMDVYIKSKVIKSNGNISCMGLNFTNTEGKMTFNPLALTAGTMTFEFKAEKEGYLPATKTISIQVIDPSQKETPKKDFRGPSVSNATLLPTVTAPKDTISVSAAVTDQGVGIKEVSLFYKVGGQTAWSAGKQLIMAYYSADNLYKGFFAAPWDIKERSKVYYYFRAVDKNNNWTVYPANAPVETKFFEVKPPEAPILPSVAILNLYSDPAVINLNKGEKDTVKLHLITTNTGSVSASLQAVITLNTNQKPNFYQGQLTLTSMPNQNQDFVFQAPIDDSLIGQKVSGSATIEDVERKIVLSSGEKQNLLEIKQKPKALEKVELQITNHWSDKSVYKVGEKTQILVVLTNSGDVDLKNVKVTNEFLQPLSQAIFWSQSKTISSLKKNKSATVSFSFISTSAQENQNIGIRITAGTKENPELAKTAAIDNYFEVRPADKENYIVANNVRFKNLGLTFEKKLSSDKKSLGLKTKFKLQITNQNKGLLSGRTLYANFNINRLWRDAAGNLKYTEVLNSRNELKNQYYLAGGGQKTVSWDYDFSKSQPGIYQMKIWLEKETKVLKSANYETLFSTDFTIVGKVTGQDFLDTEKNFLLANQALLAYQNLSDLSKLDYSLEKEFGPYRQFMMFSTPVMAEFFRMVSGAPNYLDMQDVTQSYSKAGVILVSAQFFGDTVSEGLGIILDLVDYLNFAADPESSGLYKSLQQATDKSWEIGTYGEYERAVKEHSELINKFKDLYLTSAIKLVNGQIAEVENLFIKDTNAWAYDYNYFFGFGGMHKDTIYNAYRHYNLDFIVINSSVQDQYLAGTSKGFYKNLLEPLK